MNFKLMFLSAALTSTSLFAIDSDGQKKVIEKYSCYKFTNPKEQARCYDWLYTDPEYKQTDVSQKWLESRKLSPTRKITESPKDLKGVATYDKEFDVTLDGDKFPTKEIAPAKEVVPPSKYASFKEKDKTLEIKEGKAKSAPKAKKEEIYFEIDDYEAQQQERPRSVSIVMKQVGANFAKAIDLDMSFETLEKLLKEDGCNTESALKGVSGNKEDALRKNCFNQVYASMAANRSYLEKQFNTLYNEQLKDCPIAQEAASLLVSQKLYLYAEQQQWLALQKKTNLLNHCDIEKKFLAWVGTKFDSCPNYKAELIENFRSKGENPSIAYADDYTAHQLICKSESSIAQSGKEVNPTGKAVINAARKESGDKAPAGAKTVVKKGKGSSADQ